MTSYLYKVVSEIAEILKNGFHKESIVRRLRGNPEELLQTIQITLNPDHPQGWRSAWVLKEILGKNDPRLTPHMDRLLRQLADRPDGHQRELLHLIMKCDLTDDQEGWLYDACVKIWMSIRKSSSARIMAFRQLIRLVKKYPELKHELKILTGEEYVDALSPGVKRSCQKLINEVM